MPLESQFRPLPPEESELKPRPEIVRTLEICPNCGEPVLGSGHNCHELENYIKRYDLRDRPNSLVRLYDEAKSHWHPSPNTDSQPDNGPNPEPLSFDFQVDERELWKFEADKHPSEIDVSPAE
ncbi:MAG: hypothetical protein Q7K33_03585 [Candidatus Berkelbacteria bacterium]|nr:hypothetical protein [Candidatus Berkelbacteria bacterium]